MDCQCLARPMFVVYVMASIVVYLNRLAISRNNSYFLYEDNMLAGKGRNIHVI